jgi:pimeloyl-ACP methyl ester carboxylesterase
MTHLLHIPPGFNFYCLVYFQTNWSGICDELTIISNHTLIITGTHDNNVRTANPLIIAGKILGAWLVKIKDAGHALFMQYLDKFNRLMKQGKD